MQPFFSPPLTLRALLCGLLVLLCAPAISYAEEEEEEGDSMIESAGSYSWPLWTVWNGQEGQHAFYFPSFLTNWNDFSKVSPPEVEPLALYSVQVDEYGVEKQSMLFHLIRSENSGESSSLSIAGPVLRMGNHTADEPYLEVLGGFIGLGYPENGSRPGFKLLWIEFAGGQKDAAPRPKVAQTIRRITPIGEHVELAMNP